MTCALGIPASLLARVAKMLHDTDCVTSDIIYPMSQIGSRMYRVYIYPIYVVLHVSSRKKVFLAPA